MMDAVFCSVGLFVAGSLPFWGGLRGLLRGRPLLFSTRWAWAAFALAMMSVYVSSLASRLTAHGPWVVGGALCVLLTILALVWWGTRGVMVVGMRLAAVRERLRSALTELRLPFQEDSGAILLPGHRVKIRIGSSCVGLCQVVFHPGGGQLVGDVRRALRAHLGDDDVEVATGVFRRLLYFGVALKVLALTVLALGALLFILRR